MPDQLDTRIEVVIARVERLARDVRDLIKKVDRVSDGQTSPKREHQPSS
jgi:hypothetical protein